MRPYFRAAVFILGTVTLASAQFYFGRNKIQYHPFSWHVLTTPHFEIYYYEEEADLAAAGAHFAEEAFTDLEKKFNFTLVEKVPLIFYSSHLHFQQTNTLPYLIPEGVGGFFEFVKGRVVIPYEGSTYQFRRVIRHELVHVFMHNKVAQTLSMYNLTTYRPPPLWFTEGLAEFWASDWDSKAEMVIRDALLNDYLVPLDRLSLANSGFLLYKEGQSFLRFIDSVYGSEKILMILEGIWRDNDFYEVMEIALGKDFDIIVDEWTYWYKKKIYPLLDTKDVARETSRRITEKGINSAPVYYPAEEGDKVIFLTNRTGYSDIHVQALTGEAPERGSELLLKGERKAELESLHFLNTGIDVNDEGILVFPSKSGPTDVLNMFHVPTREMGDIFRDPGIVSIQSPNWNSRGDRIVFSALDWRGYQDLYLLDVNRMDAVRLTADFYADRDPTFSPNGDEIVFSSDRGGHGKDGYFNLFSYDLTDSSVTPLTQGEFNDVSPQWSDAQNGRLLFSSDRDGTYNIWMLELNKSTSPLQLTHLATGAFDPRWSGENDESVLFTSFEDFRFHIHHIDEVGKLIPKADTTRIQPAQKEDQRWDRKLLTVDKTEKNVPYKRKYSFDIAQTAVAHDPIFGFLGGAQVSISDLLGNSYYHFLLFNTADRSSDFLNRFNLAVTRVDLSRRINYGYGFFHFANEYFSHTDGFFFERRYGLQFALSYPFSVFNRVEVSSSASRTDRDLFLPGEEKFEAFLVSNSVSYVFDNSMWGPVGPTDGNSLRLTLGRTIDFTHSEVYYTTFLTDVRKYFRISLNALYAVRVMTWLNSGRDVYQFRIGGSWGLRGFRRHEVAGTNFFLINNELRFPFAKELVLRFSSVDISISPIRAAAFIDVGNAWDEDLDLPPIASYGVGLRGNLLGAIVLRLDAGWTTESEDPFLQFFFGWDY